MNKNLQNQSPEKGLNKLSSDRLAAIMARQSVRQIAQAKAYEAVKLSWESPVNVPLNTPRQTESFQNVAGYVAVANQSVQQRNPYAEAQPAFVQQQTAPVETVAAVPQAAPFEGNPLLQQTASPEVVETAVDPVTAAEQIVAAAYADAQNAQVGAQ